MQAAPRAVAARSRIHRGRPVRPPDRRPGSGWTLVVNEALLEGLLHQATMPATISRRGPSHLGHGLGPPAVRPRMSNKAAATPHDYRSAPMATIGSDRRAPVNGPSTISRQPGLTSASTKVALVAAKARGTVLGACRGHTVTACTPRQVRADARLTDLMPVLDELRAAGTTSLGGIAVALNARGIPAARGGAWMATQVRRVETRVP